MDQNKPTQHNPASQAVGPSALRILVTGASGSLGKQLLYELTRQGYHPIAHVRDTSRTDYVDALGLEKRLADLRVQVELDEVVRGVDVVINTVAWVNFRRDRLTQFTGINTIGAINLYRATREAGVKRFIQVSTVGAIGAVPRTTHRSRHTSIPANEDFAFNLRHLQIPYIMTKRAAEEELLKLAAQGGPELVIINPSIMVAPSRTGDDRGKALRRFNRPVLPGFHNLVNLVDIRDVAPAIVRAITMARAGQRYILAGDNMSARDLILTISAALQITPHVWSMPRLVFDVAGWAAGFYHRMRTMLGGKHKISFYPDIVKLLDYDWTYSSMKAREELGFRPRSLHVTLKDLLSNNFSGTYQKP